VTWARIGLHWCADNDDGSAGAGEHSRPSITAA
jgi:hypothetical protein